MNKKNSIERRKFLKSSAAIAMIPALGMVPPANAYPAVRESLDQQAYKIKLSCNFYSLNEPLRSGKMSLDEAIEFCAQLGFDAIDLTAYYIAGYPRIPEDHVLYNIKRKAFLLGMDMSGTGVRNDFTMTDPAERDTNISLVKDWVLAAAKLDAPVVRTFTGHFDGGQDSYEGVFDLVSEGFKECAAFGKEHGVMITLQNHDYLLKSADQILRMRDRVDSEWFGLMVDIGSLRTGDPYEEIAKLAPHAATWQMKEYLYRNGQKEKTDVNKTIQIIKDAGYRGYLPIETLGPEDPIVQLPIFLDEVREALG